MVNTVHSPEISVAQGKEMPFHIGQHILTHHLINGKNVPVVGVVLTPGPLTTLVRIRRLDGRVVVLVAMNRELEAR